MGRRQGSPDVMRWGLFLHLAGLNFFRHYPSENENANTIRSDISRPLTDQLPGPNAIMLMCSAESLVHLLVESRRHVRCLLHTTPMHPPASKPHRIFPVTWKHLKRTISCSLLHVSEENWRIFQSDSHKLGLKQNAYFQIRTWTSHRPPVHSLSMSVIVSGSKWHSEPSKSLLTVNNSLETKSEQGFSFCCGLYHSVL